MVSLDVLSRTILEDGTIRSERLIGVQQDSPKWVNRVSRSLKAFLGPNDAPRELNSSSLFQLLGSQDVTFVREVSFVVPSALGHPTDPSLSSPATNHHEPPKLLMASTNLTLSYLLQCRESISYLPHPWPHAVPETLEQLAPPAATLPERPASTPPTPITPPHPLSHPALPSHTLFSQSALIYSTGIFASNPYPPVGISKASPIEPLSMPRAKTLPQRAAGRKVETWSTERFEMNAENGRAAMEHAARSFWMSEAVEATMSA